MTKDNYAVGDDVFLLSDRYTAPVRAAILKVRKRLLRRTLYYVSYYKLEAARGAARVVVSSYGVHREEEIPARPEEKVIAGEWVTSKQLTEYRKSS